MRVDRESGEAARAFVGKSVRTTVFGKREPPRAGTLSPAGPHDNNKDQFDSGNKMQK